jgi:hypothetical protein
MKNVKIYFYTPSDTTNHISIGRVQAYAMYDGLTLNCWGDTKEKAINHLMSLIQDLKNAEIVTVEVSCAGKLWR